MKYSLVKFLSDRTLSCLALIVLLPLLAAIAFLILLLDGPPVLFRQERIGKNGKPFRIIKFRTIGQSNLPSSARATQNPTLFGTFLRRLSIDELPNLWNVVIGQMSLVGPRPLLPEYLPIYSEAHRQRHVVRPGVTGLAQVSGRNAISWKEKLDLDIEYTRTMSLFIDLQIALKTIRLLLFPAPLRGTKEEMSPPLEQDYLRADRS